MQHDCIGDVSEDAGEEVDTKRLSHKWFPMQQTYKVAVCCMPHTCVYSPISKMITIIIIKKWNANNNNNENNKIDSKNNNNNGSSLNVSKTFVATTQWQHQCHIITPSSKRWQQQQQQQQQEKQQQLTYSVFICKLCATTTKTKIDNKCQKDLLVLLEWKLKRRRMQH